MIRKTIVFSMCLIFMLCGPMYAQQIPVSDTLYAEIVNGTVLPYFNALKDGDVGAIKKYIAGRLYQKYKVLLEQNTEYPAYLRNYYQGAEFRIGKAAMIDNDVIVEVTSDYPNGRSNNGKLVLWKDNGTETWKIIKSN